MRPTLLACLLILLPSILCAADPPATTAPLFDDNGTHLTIAQFVAKYIPADMTEGLGRKEVQAALEDAGANWVELAKALLWPSDGRHGHGVRGLIWLITTCPHLDRLELTSDDLIDTINRGQISGNIHGFQLESDLYRRYLLSYRFDDEPVSEWRTVYEKYMPVPKEWELYENQSNRFTSRDIVEKYASGFTIIDKGYFGNLSDPVSLLHSRAGTKRELSILVAAALRSQGYATRFVRENRSGESWVEVYSGDPRTYDASAWTPVYPTAPDQTGDVSYATELCGGRICVVTAGDALGREQVTSRYTATGHVSPVFYDTDTATGGPHEDNDFSGWAITAWNDQTGAYVPLDDLEYPSSDKDYPLDESAANTPKLYELGPGDYRLESGVRYPGGISHVQTQEFGVPPNVLIKLEAHLDPPPDLPQTALVERQVANFTDSPRLMHHGRYVFLVGDGGEPSLRALDALKGLETMSSVYYQHWRMVGATDEDHAFVKDVLKVDETKDNLPVVIVVVDGVTKMYLQGYNLNVAQWVDRALGGNGE